MWINYLKSVLLPHAYVQGVKKTPDLDIQVSEQLVSVSQNRQKTGLSMLLIIQHGPRVSQIAFLVSHHSHAHGMHMLI